MMLKIFVALVMFVSATAFAQPYAVLDISTDSDMTVVGRPTMNGSSVTIGAGYRLNQYLSAELSYFDGDGRSDPIRAAGVETIHFWKSTGLGISALGTMPAGAFSLLGQVGAYKLQSDFRTLVTDLTAGSTVSDTATGTSGWVSDVSIGLQFAFSKSVALRAMLAQREGGDIQRLRSITIGVSASF